MDFKHSERTATLVSTARSFVERELLPIEQRFLSAPSWKSLAPTLDELRRKARATGFFAPHMPKDVGGAGLSLLELAAVGEELGKSPLGHYSFNCQAPDAGNMELLHKHGTAEQ